MNAAENRSVAELIAEIETKGRRNAEIGARIAVIASEVEQLRRLHGRAIADGSEDIEDGTPATIRALSEEEEGLRRALTIIAEDLVQLEAAAKSARAVEAAVEEETCVSAAAQMLEQVHERIQSLILEEIIPLADKLDAALSRARSAQDDLARATGERAQPFGSDPLPLELVEQRGGTLVILRRLRDYAAGVPLNEVSFHARQRKAEATNPSVQAA